MSKPIVAIIGRPNVGKSTFFNYIIGERKSIVEDTPGVTRDRIYGDVVYKDYKFHLIDTGGIDVSKELFNSEIKIQAEIAINEAVYPSISFLSSVGSDVPLFPTYLISTNSCSSTCSFFNNR